MKVVMITDCKPHECKDCIFYSEIFEQDSENENHFEIIEGCSLTNQRHSKCPLTEDKDYMAQIETSKIEYTVIVE